MPGTTIIKDEGKGSPRWIIIFHFQLQMSLLLLEVTAAPSHSILACGWQPVYPQRNVKCISRTQLGG